MTTEKKKTFPLAKKDAPSPALRRRLFFLLLFLLYVLALLFSGTLAEGVVRGCLLALSVVLPAVFPFLLLSDLLFSTLPPSENSGAARLFSRIFSLPEALFPSFLIGMISGFPVGFRSVGVLFRQGKIRRTDAERALSLCSAPSPVFVLFGIGRGLFSDIGLGVRLLLAEAVSVIAVGFVSGQIAARKKRRKNKAAAPAVRDNTLRYTAKERNTVRLAATGSAPLRQPALRSTSAGTIPAEEASEKTPPKPPRPTFTSVIGSAVGVSLSMLGVFAFFGALSALLEKLLPPALFLATSSLLEMTSFASALAKSGLPSALVLPLLGFSVTFCGFSVHLQCFSTLPDSSEKLSLFPYLTAKVFSGLLAAFFLSFSALFL